VPFIICEILVLSRFCVKKEKRKKDPSALPSPIYRYPSKHVVEKNQSKSNQNQIKKKTARNIFEKEEKTVIVRLYDLVKERI